MCGGWVLTPPQATGHYVVINGVEVSLIGSTNEESPALKTGDFSLVGPVGLEPTTYGLKVRSSTN